MHEQVLPNLISRACNYITEKAQSDQPYFLYLPLPAPHTPILPIDEYRGKSGLGEYGDFVLMVDDMVGKVLNAVKQSGEEDNTIVVFTTDNGCSPAAGITELKAQGHLPNFIYRGHKADLFDGGHRIPCILKWPAKVKPHKVNQTICLTDFYATFAAINDYSLLDSEGEDSYNLLPALLSERRLTRFVRQQFIILSMVSSLFVKEIGNFCSQQVLVVGAFLLLIIKKLWKAFLRCSYMI